MKIFVYKTLFIFFMAILLFHITIGPLINNFEQKIINIQSKENIELIKVKLRNEIKDAVKKKKYLNDEDRELIIAFIDKVKSELKKKP